MLNIENNLHSTGEIKYRQILVIVKQLDNVTNELIWNPDTMQVSHGSQASLHC